MSGVLFKAACPDCRSRFELAAGALRLAIGGSRRTTFYSFTCPACDSAVRSRRGADRGTADPGRRTDAAAGRRGAAAADTGEELTRG
ncbi:hypothetical protein ACFQVA_05995 [Actinomadura keratinilytica]